MSLLFLVYTLFNLNLYINSNFFTTLYDLNNYITHQENVRPNQGLQTEHNLCTILKY